VYNQAGIGARTLSECAKVYRTLRFKTPLGHFQHSNCFTITHTIKAGANWYITSTELRTDVPPPHTIKPLSKTTSEHNSNFPPTFSPPPARHSSIPPPHQHAPSSTLLLFHFTDPGSSQSSPPLRQSEEEEEEVEAAPPLPPPLSFHAPKKESDRRPSKKEKSPDFLQKCIRVRPSTLASAAAPSSAEELQTQCLEPAATGARTRMEGWSRRQCAFLGCAIAEEGDEVGDEEGAGFGRDGCEGRCLRR